MLKMNRNLAIMILAVILLLGLAGCAQATTPVETPTEVALLTEEPTLPPTQEPAPTEPVEEPTEEPTAEPTEDTETTETETTEDVANESGAADACLECHTDQQMLIDTADPVEEVESEDEGAG